MHGCRLQLAVKEMRLQEKLRREREAVEERAAAKKAVMERRRKVRERKLRAQEKKRDRTRVILKAKVGTSTGDSVGVGASIEYVWTFPNISEQI